MQESAIRRMGAILAQIAAISSRLRPGTRRPTRSRGRRSRTSRASCCPERTNTCSSTAPPAAIRPLLEVIAGDHAPACGTDCFESPASSRPDRSRGSISSRACSSIPATSSSSNCRPIPGRSPRSATCRRGSAGVPQEADGIDLAALDDDPCPTRPRGTAGPVPLRRPEFPEPDRSADRPARSGGSCSNGRRGTTSSSSKTIRIASSISRIRRSEADVRPMQGGRRAKAGSCI